MYTNTLTYTNSRLKLDKAGGRGVPDQGSPDAGICGYFKSG